MRELHQMGRFEIINVTHEQLQSALDETGYDMQDCYDPYVAAAVGREFRGDAVVCGELTHFGTRQESHSTTVMVVQGGGTQTHHYVGVSLRLVKTDNAVILYSGLGDGFAREGYTSAAAVACKQAIDPLRRYYQQIK
jgi:curli biogenesis system outer membrane secretion channel CsgG